MICLNNLSMILTSQDRVSVRGNQQIIINHSIWLNNLKRKITMKMITNLIMNSIKRKRRLTTRELPIRNFSTKMTKKKKSTEMLRLNFKWWWKLQRKRTTEFSKKLLLFNVMSSQAIVSILLKALWDNQLSAVPKDLSPRNCRIT